LGNPKRNKVEYLEVLKSLVVSADPSLTLPPSGKACLVLKDSHKTTGAANSGCGQELSSGGEGF